MEQRRLKLFLDTNILLDVLCPDNRPFAESSSMIFKLIKAGKFEGELSTQSIIDAAFVASHTEGNMLESFRAKVNELSNYVNIDDMDFFSVMKAVDNCTGDFEDDAQYAFAKGTACDYVITSDRNFRKRHEGEDRFIQFFTPDELIDAITTD